MNDDYQDYQESLLEEKNIYNKNIKQLAFHSLMQLLRFNSNKVN